MEYYPQILWMFGEIISLDYEQIREPCGIAQAQPISVHFPVIRKQFGGKF